MVHSALRSVPTRFRAYQLGVAGSLFSYFAEGHFTLIEAMATEVSKPQLLAELEVCKKGNIDTLHITSWDQDHCDQTGLQWILENLQPQRIEYPGYPPHTDSGRESLTIINAYKARRTQSGLTATIQSIDPPYVRSLETGQALGYRDIVYHPRELFDRSNDNSTVKLFRAGCFNVLSLGDVEHVNIAALLKRCTILCREVDVMILAHHGADNGFTTKKLLERLAPKVAICSSNYDNQYDHPRQEICDLLWEQEIRLYTTKTGDVVLASVGSHTMDYEAINFRSNSREVSSVTKFRSRKSKHLNHGADAYRGRFERPSRGPR